MVSAASFWFQNKARVGRDKVVATVDMMIDDAVYDMSCALHRLSIVVMSFLT